MIRLQALSIVLLLALAGAGCGGQQNNRAGSTDELPPGTTGFWTAVGDGWALALPEGFKRRKPVARERTEGVTAFQLGGDRTAQATVTPLARSGSFSQAVRAATSDMRTDTSNWKVTDDVPLFLSTLRETRRIEAKREGFRRIDLIIEGMKGERYALSLRASDGVYRRLRLADSVLAFRIQ